MNIDQQINQCENLMRDYANAGDMLAYNKMKKRLERLQKEKQNVQ